MGCIISLSRQLLGRKAKASVGPVGLNLLTGAPDLEDIIEPLPQFAPYCGQESRQWSSTGRQMKLSRSGTHMNLPSTVLGPLLSHIKGCPKVV